MSKLEWFAKGILPNKNVLYFAGAQHIRLLGSQQLSTATLLLTKSTISLATSKACSWWPALWREASLLGGCRSHPPRLLPATDWAGDGVFSTPRCSMTVNPPKGPMFLEGDLSELSRKRERERSVSCHFILTEDWLNIAGKSTTCKTSLQSWMSFAIPPHPSHLDTETSLWTRSGSTAWW